MPGSGDRHVAGRVDSLPIPGTIRSVNANHSSSSWRS
jgi:hypothetical protein